MVITIIVVQQVYEAEVNNVYVIRQNSAILKCSIPSFVADFVSVESWLDDESNEYYNDGKFGTQSDEVY